MKNTLLGSIYLALAASIWGGMYVVVKVVVAIIPPLELVWIRYVIAILALVIIGSIKRQSWRISKRHIPLIVTIGVNAIQRIKRKAGRYLEVEKAM